MRSKQNTCATPQGRGNAPIDARRNFGHVRVEKRSRRKANSRARLDDGIMRVEKWSVQDMDGVPHMDQC